MEVGGRFKRKGTHVYLCLIHADVWQKPMLYCKAIILQLKINKLKKNKKRSYGSKENNPICSCIKRNEIPENKFNQGGEKHEH